jgi:hypothetical protein
MFREDVEGVGLAEASGSTDRLTAAGQKRKKTGDQIMFGEQELKHQHSRPAGKKIRVIN